MQCEEIYRLAHRLECAFHAWETASRSFDSGGEPHKNRVLGIYEEIVALSETLCLDRGTLIPAVEEFRIMNATQFISTKADDCRQLREFVAAKADGVLNSLQEALKDINRTKRRTR